MTTPDPALDHLSLDDLFGRALNALQTTTGMLNSSWNLSEMDWTVNQDEGTIVFHRPDGLRAVAPVQIVGSLNTQDGSWLWAGANSSVRDELVEHAQLAQEELRRRGADDLAEDRQPADEARAWEYTALAALLGGVQGGYRGPAGPTLVFMTFGALSIRRTQA